MLHVSAVHSFPANGGKRRPREAACFPTAPETFRSVRYTLRSPSMATSSGSVANCRTHAIVCGCFSGEGLNLVASVYNLSATSDVLA